MLIWVAARARLAGHVGGCLPVGCTGLGQDVADVVSHGLVGQAQPGGDGTVGQAAGRTRPARQRTADKIHELTPVT